MLRALCILAGLLLPATVSAQLTLMGVGGGSTNGPSYTGPGDVVASAFFWAGVRAYSRAQALAGAKALQLCTAADASCEDETVDGTGNLHLGAVGAACIAGACTVKTFYDQSGSGFDVTQATIANRATFTPSCKNGKPCLACPGTASSGYLSGAVSTHAVPFTYLFIGDRTANFTTVQSTIDTFTVGSKAGLGFNNTTNTLFAFDGGSGQTVTGADSSFHSLQTVFAGASSIMYIDGVSNAKASLGSNGTGTPIAICTRNDSTQPFHGNYIEGGIWLSGFNSTQLGSMYSNQTAWYGSIP